MYEGGQIVPSDVDRRGPATTIVTNVLIERKGKPTALLVTEGFRDVPAYPKRASL
jgi:N-methylhydantoinase A